MIATIAPRVVESSCRSPRRFVAAASSSCRASVGPDGAIVADTFREEFLRTMENVWENLAACGLELADAVQIREYLRDASDPAVANQRYREYFSPPDPARTTLNNRLDTLRDEVEVIARYEADSRRAMMVASHRSRRWS